MTRSAKKKKKKVTLHKEKKKLTEIYSEMTEILELVFKDIKITLTNTLILNDLEKNRNIMKKEIDDKKTEWTPRDEKYRI